MSPSETVQPALEGTLPSRFVLTFCALESFCSQHNCGFRPWRSLTTMSWRQSMGGGGHRGGHGFDRRDAYRGAHPFQRQHEACDEVEQSKAMEMFQNRNIPIETEGCALPDPSSFGTAAPWTLPRMTSARVALNATKDTLDHYDRRCEALQCRLARPCPLCTLPQAGLIRP